MPNWQLFTAMATYQVRQLFEMDDFERNEDTDRFRKLEAERKK